MYITKDYTAAKRMIKIFQAIANNEIIKVQDIDSILKTTKAYQKWLSIVGGKFFLQEYLIMWEKILNKKQYTGKLSNVYQKYNIILKNIDLLNVSLKFAQKIDFSLVEKLVTEYLPPETEIKVKIYFLIDGYNGGTIIDQHNYTQCIWALDPKYFECCGVYGLVHELHHIGSLYWHNEDDLRKELISKNNHVSLAVKLVRSVLDEGSAVFYADKQVDRDIMYEVASKQIGGNQFDRILDAYKIAKSKVSQRIEELDKLLQELIDGVGKYDIFKSKVRSYGFMQGIKPALNKLIGEEMVGSIDKVFGKEKIFDCLINLKEFLFVYNEAARKLNKVEFSEKLLTKWDSIWSEKT